MVFIYSTILIFQTQRSLKFLIFDCNYTWWCCLFEKKKNSYENCTQKKIKCHICLEFSYNEYYSHFAIYPADTLGVTDGKYLKFIRIWARYNQMKKYFPVIRFCMNKHMHKCFAQDCWLKKMWKTRNANVFRMVNFEKKK